MGGLIIYNYKNKDDLIYLINRGCVNVKEISEKCNCNIKTASGWLNKFDLIFQRKLITVPKNKIKEDLENLTSKDFCNKYKVSESSIPRWKRHLGISVFIGRNRSLNNWVKKDGYYVGYTKNTNIKFFIDEENYETVKNYTWRESDSGYIETHINGKRYFQHRFILFGFNREVNLKNGIVDHINQNKRDNRKNNLRITSNSVNQLNRGLRKDNKSGYTGVSYCNRDDVFKASISRNNEGIELGTFKSFEEAIKIRQQIERNLYSEVFN